MAFGSSSKSTAPSPSLFHSLYSRPDLAYSVYRHVVVLESVTRAGRLFGFLPPNILTSKQLACDPVPPPTSISEYDPAFFEGAEDPLAVRPRNRRENARMLEQLVPDPVFRRQLEDFFNANPQFAQRFPGGVVEFAQVAAQMPEEVLEDLMIEIANQNQGGAMFEGAQHGNMPGRMPGLEGPDDEDLPDLPPVAGQAPTEEGDEEEEDDEEEVEAAPLPVRLLRNVMNRFWGGGREQDDESSEDELRDEAGVD